MSRLIDADELQKYIVNNVPLKNFMARDVGKADQNMLNIINIIEAMPTIDAVPVKHGNLCVGEGFYPPTCSDCGKRIRTPGYVGTVNFYKENFPYCPNCGAKFDEVSE